MSARVSLAVTDDGRLLAVKTALDALEASALVREAEAIRVAAHAGVVSLHDLRDDPSGLQLRTLWVGTRSVVDLRHAEPARAGALCAGVAVTLADLHERGLVHGRVEASHVLLRSAPEQPVLCSLGASGLAGEQVPGSTRLLRPSNDVADLGRLLSGILELPSPAGSPRWGRRAREQEQHRAALHGLAIRAAAPDPADRPSARALAGALLAASGRGPTARPGSSREASPGHRPLHPRRTSTEVWEERGRTHRPLRPRRTAAAGVLGVASIAAAVGAVGAAATTDRSERAAEHPVTALDSEPTATTGRSSEPPGDAPVVTVGAHRYAVGRPGDQASVADWRCEGTHSVLLLRPGTGAVFLFEAPMPEGDPVAPVAHVEPGSHLLPPDPDRACPSPSAVEPTGNRRVAIQLPIDRSGRA